MSPKSANNTSVFMRLSFLVIPMLSLFIGLGAALAIAAVVGESPLKVLQVIFEGALGGSTQLGYSLYFATPLLLTGLAVAWAFRAGLFNIGAEGQMTLGGLALSAFGITFSHWPWFVALPGAALFAFVVGGLWGGLAGWIKAKRGCHEVLTTILLNFVAYGIASFFILTVFKNPDSQVPETSMVGLGYQIPQMAWLGGTSPLNLSFIFSLLLVILYGWIFRSTKLGFYQRMTGGAHELGRRAGINMDRQTLLAMFISGGIAGLAGLSPVLGFAFKTREGFTAGLGFVGVAVALLGRNSATGIIFAAILFGVLTKGALDLDLDTEKVSRDLATVIQALVVLSVASQAGLSSLWQSWQNRRRA